jgi:hypothetical protein
VDPREPQENVHEHPVGGRRSCPGHHPENTSMRLVHSFRVRMRSLLNKEENLHFLLLIVAVALIIPAGIDAYNNGLTIHSIVLLVVGAVVLIVGVFLARRSRSIGVPDSGSKPGRWLGRLMQLILWFRLAARL